MATTFTSNYQIKLIGTGLEAGTWGSSTNENIKRIEQGIGGSKFGLVVTAPGGASSWTPGTKTLEWITSDSADAGAAGSEGRNAFVELTGDPTAAFIVEIRGGDSSEIPDRTFLLRNSTSYTASLDVGTGTDYDLLSGCTAFVFTNTTGTDTVGNLLGTLQLDGLNFPAEADITIEDGQADALEIKDGTTGRTYVDITTNSTLTSSSIGLTAGELDLDTATVTAATQATSLLIKDNTDAALNIMEGTNSYIEFDSQNAKPQVVIGGGTSDCDTLDIDTPTVDLSTQATVIDLKDADTAALVIRDPDGTLLTFSTQDTGAERITSAVELKLTKSVGCLSVDGTSGFSDVASFTAGVNIDGAGNMDDTVIGANNAAAITGTTITGTSIAGGTVAGTTITGTGLIKGPDALITGPDGYVNFNTPEGSGGIGVRNNGGSIEASNGSGSWEFDIGPIRVIYNTVLVNGGDTITLGDSGEGTSVSMDSALYTVMSSWADASDGVSTNYGVHVLDSSAGTMSVNGAGTDRRLTYWAIGDSGN